jgi:hypothetical protein
MTLGAFDILGETVSDDETEEIIRAGDPRRSLIRYRPGKSDTFVSVRMNMALLRAAAAHSILHVKPRSPDDEVMQIDDLLTPGGSSRNYLFLERLCQGLAGAGFAACFLAEQHGDRRRDFYFATEDASGLPLSIEQHGLADVAPIILPTEAIGDLGLQIPAGALRATRFEFWGAESSLARLRAQLERRGYRFLSMEAYLRELRMIKDVPIDVTGFRTVLEEIVTLSRALGCSYRGTETVDGHDQFALARPLPQRYAARSPLTGALRSVFGRKRS